ncbi:MAG: gas vesicle protein GvpG [Acidimicrobiales bacterium]
MGILGKVLMLPLAPVGGVIWLAEQLERQAADIYYGPEAIRRDFDELQQAYDRGEITVDELREAETQLLERFEMATDRTASDAPTRWMT